MLTSAGSRPDPDALLSSIQREEASSARGRLKVFLGMCPGVGKTFAMLESARREHAAGRDVVIGLVETHGRQDTEALASNLPAIPRKHVEYKGITLTEMDIDEILARHPQLVLVDELAHTNAPGSRHPKRWQDVQELRDAGIDVCTTLNVQHVESRADTVRQITGAEIRETVPDGVLDDAVIELCDLPPAELLERLREGKVYVPDRAAVAAQNFFREANLTALREIALRLTADHVAVSTRELRQLHTGAGPWKTGDRLLVAVGPGPSSVHLIRWTRRMADALACSWVAVHVQRAQPLSDVRESRIAKDLATARELGGDTIVTSDEDIVGGLLRVAHEQNITQIVVGKPSGSGSLEWAKGSRLLWRLARESGDIDVHVVRAEANRPAERRWPWKPRFQSRASQYLLALAGVGATTLINEALRPFVGPRVPGLVFLLAVVLGALVLGRGPVLMAGALSALLWNFFFLPPRYTFTIERPEDGLLFVTYFVVALVLGQLVARVRAQQIVERQREERALALYQLTRDLGQAASRDEVIWHLMMHITHHFRAASAVCIPRGDKIIVHPDSILALTDKELAVADWAFRRNKPAGRFTDNLPGAGALHIPLFTDRKTFGVLAVSVEKELPLAQRELLNIFAQQTALALDRADLRALTAQARLLAESERLSRVLLNSISHELRTPLAAIVSATGALADAETKSPELRRAMIGELEEGCARLDRVIGNLLDLARLEQGNVRPRMDWHDVRDVVRTTAAELKKELEAHTVRLVLPESPLLARLDFSLVQHALANLLLNAAMHTPAGTPIEVHAEARDDNVVLSVSDRGPGISPELAPHIFEKFYRAPGAPAGGSGLGLSIAKGFIEAQGGSISFVSVPIGGACFMLTLPQTEITPTLEPGA